MIGGPRSTRRAWAVDAALVAVRVVTAILILHAPATFAPRHALIGDLLRWRVIARATGTPYRDVPIEYPPLTWAVAHAYAVGSVQTAAWVLVWSQVVLDLLVAVGLAVGWGRSSATAYLVVGLTMTVWPFVYLRLDLLPVVLVTWGLAALRRARPRLAGIVLAVACFAKVWPVAFLPLLVARRERRAAVTMTVAGAAGLVAWVVWGGAGAPGEVLTFRHARGWQIESVVGAIVRVTGRAAVHVEAGAWRVGRMGTAGRLIPDLVLGALVLVAAWLLSRVADPGPALADGIAGLTVVAAMLACATIFSPQYAAWLLPFAAIAATGRQRAAAGLGAVVCGLSSVAMRAYQPIVQGTTNAEILVIGRNVAVVTLVIVGLVTLRRAARAPTGTHSDGHGDGTGGPDQPAGEHVGRPVHAEVHP